MRPVKKATMCKYIAKGFCRLGQQCPFAHTAQERDALRSQQSLDAFAPPAVPTFDTPTEPQDTTPASYSPSSMSSRGGANGKPMPYSASATGAGSNATTPTLQPVDMKSTQPQSIPITSSPVPAALDSAGSPSRALPWRGNASLIIDGAYLCKSFKSVSLPGIKDIERYIGLIEERWGFGVSTYHSLYVSTNPKYLRPRERELALRQLHKHLRNELCFEVWEADLKENGTQAGADCKITIELLKMARHDKISAIVLLAGDRDFLPALEEIKRNEIYRKEVYLLTWEASSSQHLGTHVVERLCLDQVN